MHSQKLVRSENYIVAVYQPKVIALQINVGELTYATSKTSPLVNMILLFTLMF